jgi:hypothetical protein
MDPPIQEIFEEVLLTISWCYCISSNFWDRTMNFSPWN